MGGLGFSIGSITKLFSRPPPIRTLADMEDFIDRHTAFTIQKGIVEYCRARSGVLWSKLFKEPAFMDSLNRARWRSFGIGVGNVAEMIDAALYPRAGADRATLLEAITVAGRHVLQRYPVPQGEADDFWLQAIAVFERRMAAVKLRAPRPVRDIPVATVREIFELLPIHAEVRAHDFEPIKNNIRVNLCRSYETFIQQLEEDALVADLKAPRAPVKVPSV